jgi:hypothetical protein
MVAPECPADIQVGELAAMLPRRQPAGRLGMIAGHARWSGSMNEWVAFGIVVVIWGVLAWLVNPPGDDGDSSAGRLATAEGPRSSACRVLDPAVAGTL